MGPRFSDQSWAPSEWHSTWRSSQSSALWSLGIRWMALQSSDCSHPTKLLQWHSLRWHINSSVAASDVGLDREMYDITYPLTQSQILIYICYFYGSIGSTIQYGIGYGYCNWFTILVWCGYALLGHKFWFGVGILTGSQILVCTLWENWRHMFSLTAGCLIWFCTYLTRKISHLIRRKLSLFSADSGAFSPTVFAVVELGAVLAQEEWRNHSENRPLYSGVLDPNCTELDCPTRGWSSNARIFLSTQNLKDFRVKPVSPYIQV